MSDKTKAAARGRSLPQNVLYMLRLVWGYDRTLFALLAVEPLCKVAMPFFGIYLPKLAIDLVTAAAPVGEAALKIGLLTAGMAAAYFLGNFADRGKYMRYNALRFVLYARLFFRTLDCDYAYLESPKGQADYGYVLSCLDNGDGSVTSRFIPALSSLAMGVLGFGAYSAILATLHPLVIVLLIATSVGAYLAMRRAVRYERSRDKDIGGAFQKVNYFNKVGSDTAYGKETRLYGLRGLMVAMREKAIAELTALHRDMQGKWFFSGATDAVITLLRDGLAYAYLIWQVLAGNMAVGDFVLYFGAIAGFSAWLTAIFRQFSTVSGANHDIGRIRDFLELTSSADPEPAAEPLDPHAPHSVAFENVTFAYEKGGVPTLDRFDMRIAAGEKVALVGVNGAGKTTVVKLLCGFYEPDEGRILIDGVDLCSFRREDLYPLFSAVFQDTMTLPVALGENVALRGRDSLNRERVEQCLKKAGLWEDISQMPKGVDTMLGRERDESGVELSGGQQQKLLLARALYKNAPLLILDEPTAALDPIAESRLYGQYHELAHSKTSLFISHRLASTRFCDKIVFIDGGRAAETGSHEDLMRAGGGYARMYEVQSHYYNENPDGSGEEATI